MFFKPQNDVEEAVRLSVDFRQRVTLITVPQQPEKQTKRRQRKCVMKKEQAEGSVRFFNTFIRF